MSDKKTFKQTQEAETAILSVLNGFTSRQARRILDSVKYSINSMSVIDSSIVRD